MQSLTTENFFKYFINRPGSQELSVQDSRLAWAASLILGVVTLGVAHAVSAIFFRSFKLHPPGTTTTPLKLFQEIHTASPLPESVLPETPVIEPFTSAYLAEQASLYGNKTANLMRLQELFRGEEDVVVPAFEGINKGACEEYIQREWPAFTTLWKAFVEEGADPSSPHLGEIQKGLQKLFAESKDFPPEAALAPLLAQRKPLMVRSTGKEDSLEVANPGGNESVSNVAPDSTSVRKALGDVLASYFSAKSLAQRKLSGDDITVVPPLPVLLQIMFGEVEGGPIPLAGVMYTREPELMTEGIIQVCSTLGHAEGVVTGSAPCDTYYITDSSIHSIIEEKPSRRAPAREGGLTTKPNPEEQRLVPTLGEKELKRLAEIGHKIEAKYGMPMDIEWGFSPEEGRFYLFQARPIPPKTLSSPSYIAPEHLSLLEHPQKITALGSGGGKVLSLHKGNTSLSATAPEALARYLANPSPKPAAILITSPTARNSHEAAFFRSLGIPIIQISAHKAEGVAKLLDTRTLLVDMQEGALGVLPVGAKEEDFITPGLRRFLAPSHESTPLTNLSAAARDAFKKELLVSSTGIDAKEVNARLKTFPGWNALDRLLNGFEKAPTREERSYILALFLTIIEKQLLKDIPPERKEAFLSKLFYNSRALWRTYSEESSSLEQKFAMNWVRSCIEHTSEETHLSLGESLMTLLSEKKERALLELPVADREEDVSVTAYKDVFERSSKFIINPSTRASWHTFINHLDLEGLKKLASFFALLGPEGVELALNTVFAKTWDSLKGLEAKVQAERCLEGLKAAMTDKKTLSALAKAREVSVTVQEFANLAPSFGEPDKFETLLARLEKELVPQGEELCHLLASAEGLGLVVLNKTFREMIKAFDDCIKGFTESAAYKDDPLLKCERFYQILKPYTRLLESALSDSMLAHDPVLLEQAKVLRGYLPTRLQERKTRLDDIIKEVIGEEDVSWSHRHIKRFLEPSRSFNAAYAALGSLNTAPERARIISFEDYFTTVHQSLLKASSSIATKVGLQVEDLPSSVQQICQVVTALDLDSTVMPRPTLQFIDWHYPYLQIGYNAPLNTHSAHFEIEAELGPKGDIVSLSLHGTFFAAVNSMGVGGRSEVMNSYIARSCYKEGLKASLKAFLSQNMHSTAMLSWQLPLEGTDLISSLAKASFHLQKIINFLQKEEKLLDTP